MMRHLLLIALCSCSFTTVDRVSKTGAARCTQSNWAAGVDLTVTGAAAANGVALGLKDDDVDNTVSVAVLLALATVSSASSIYGFATTHACRASNNNPSGGHDWIYVPLLATSIWIASEMDSLFGCPVTTCNDGTCSESTGSGTCSSHGGIRR